MKKLTNDCSSETGEVRRLPTGRLAHEGAVIWSSSRVLLLDAVLLAIFGILMAI